MKNLLIGIIASLFAVTTATAGNTPVTGQHIYGDVFICSGTNHHYSWPIPSGYTAAAPFRVTKVQVWTGLDYGHISDFPQLLYRHSDNAIIADSGHDDYVNGGGTTRHHMQDWGAGGVFVFLTGDAIDFDTNCTSGLDPSGTTHNGAFTVTIWYEQQVTGSVPAPFVVNANTADNTAPPVGTVFHAIGSDTSVAYWVFDSFGQQEIIVGRRANGTLGTKTNVLDGQSLIRLQGDGWDSGGNYSSNAGFAGFSAAGDFTSTSHGTRYCIYTTPIGSISFAKAACVQPGGGFAVGLSNVTTNPGDGIVLGDGIQSRPNSVGALGPCDATIAGMRKFVTDSNASSYAAGIGSVVASGGTTGVPVICDGTSWRIG